MSDSRLQLVGFRACTCPSLASRPASTSLLLLLLLRLLLSSLVMTDFTVHRWQSSHSILALRREQVKVLEDVRSCKP